MLDLKNWSKIFVCPFFDTINESARRKNGHIELETVRSVVTNKADQEAD